MLETAVLVLLVVVALGIIGLILIQQGKGADMGASFGSGASNTVFGSAGSGNFLTHSTAGLVALFFVCCLVLAWFSNHRAGRNAAADFTAPAVELKEVPAAGDVPNVAPSAPAASDVPSANVEQVPAVKAEVVPGGVAPSAPAAAETPAAPAQGATETQKTQ